MASKPKTGGTKEKPASASDKEVQKTQSERFIETARELGADESGKRFEKEFIRIAKSKDSERS